jgi:hypothetical protein
VVIQGRELYNVGQNAGQNVGQNVGKNVGKNVGQNRSERDRPARIEEEEEK